MPKIANDITYELVHNDGFGGLLSCNLNNERKVCVYQI